LSVIECDWVWLSVIDCDWVWLSVIECDWDLTKYDVKEFKE
jgi:hypothetical protein